MKMIYLLLAAVCTLGCARGYDSVDAQEFATALKNPEVQVIDVRTP